MRVVLFFTYPSSPSHSVFFYSLSLSFSLIFLAVLESCIFFVLNVLLQCEFGRLHHRFFSFNNYCRSFSSLSNCSYLVRRYKLLSCVTIYLRGQIECSAFWCDLSNWKRKIGSPLFFYWFPDCISILEWD